MKILLIMKGLIVKIGDSTCDANLEVEPSEEF
jgi:hypothetical protein